MLPGHVVVQEPFEVRTKRAWDRLSQNIRAEIAAKEEKTGERLSLAAMRRKTRMSEDTVRRVVTGYKPVLLKTLRSFIGTFKLDAARCFMGVDINDLGTLDKPKPRGKFQYAPTRKTQKGKQKHRARYHDRAHSIEWTLGLHEIHHFRGMETPDNVQAMLSERLAKFGNGCSYDTLAWLREELMRIKLILDSERTKDQLAGNFVKQLDVYPNRDA